MHRIFIQLRHPHAIFAVYLCEEFIHAQLHPLQAEHGSRGFGQRHQTAFRIDAPGADATHVACQAQLFVATAQPLQQVPLTTFSATQAPQQVSETEQVE